MPTRRARFFNLSPGSSATLDALTITGGNGDDGGGGISADSSTTLNVNDCVVSDNSAEVGGGINSEGSAVTINNTTFSGNTSQDFGAGLAAGCTDATVEGCTFSGNTSNTSSSPMGAAVWASCTNLLISDSCIEQNVGYYQGGIYLQGTTITIDNSTIADNTATAYFGNASAGVLDESGQGKHRYHQQHHCRQHKFRLFPHWFGNSWRLGNAGQYDSCRSIRNHAFQRQQQ